MHHFERVYQINIVLVSLNIPQLYAILKFRKFGHELMMQLIKIYRSPDMLQASAECNSCKTWQLPASSSKDLSVTFSR
jgi:hypothetical protein